MLTGYKKLALYVILTAYADRNGIDEFLSQDSSEFQKNKIAELTELEPEKDHTDDVNVLMSEYIDSLKTERRLIDEFNHKDTLWFQLLNMHPDFFEKNLPYRSASIKWLKKIDTIPFDPGVYFKK